MHDIIVTREVLALYDKYDGDFGLMYERWADEKDRYKLTSEQSSLLSEYVDKLHLIKIRTFAMQLLRERALKRLPEIEEVMDPKVAAILRKRVLET